MSSQISTGNDGTKLGEVTANDVLDSSATTANADGSMIERLEHLQSNGVRTVASLLVATDGGSIADVFTITGVIELIGLVVQMTEAQSATACTMAWSLDPTVGASNTPLAAALEINAFAIGDCIYVEGDASAMVKADVATLPPLMCITPPVLFAGGVDMDMQNSNPTTGIANVYLTYRPLTATATVTAA